MGEGAPKDTKAKRYDRQIRIWGPHGQQRLEDSRVCLLNCSPTGSELLKSLVLGGIHSFTIVDEAKVTNRDLGNNFLVSAESLGHSRAECVAELLKEMNDTVLGNFIEQSPEALLDGEPKFFRDFTLVVATQMREQDVAKLDALCREGGVKLLIARSYGLMGYIRISVPEHLVEDSKPDNIIWDLRLSNPFPALQDWALSFDLDSMDDVLHKHIPYTALLIQAAQQWKEAHGGSLPSSTAERREFKALVSANQRSVEGVHVEEENFSEALANIHRVWTPMRVPSEVQVILDDPSADVTPASDDFWVMVAALKVFVADEGKGLLPLDGVVPDMTATTELYLEMQRLYQKQAAADTEAVRRHVEAVLATLGRQPGSIPSASINSFCKLARNMRVLRYKPVAEEVAAKSGDESMLKDLMGDEDKKSDVSLYLLLRAADRFYQEFHRFPGSFNEEIDQDTAHLKSLVGTIISEICPNGSAPQVSDDLVAEMVRFGACELHSIAAVVGGIGAQEAIKLITGQFVPPDGTVIYNGMASTTLVFKL
mmetsp:Transcript_21156/g.58704  ORF Transcript_21156/g.58704 Transcript_21156/m.58704 type:complete len:539 (-) Transcript_21156:37-1653(-)